MKAALVVIACTDAIALSHLNKRNTLTHCAIPKQQKEVKQDGERKSKKDTLLALLTFLTHKQVVCQCNALCVSPVRHALHKVHYCFCGG